MILLFSNAKDHSTNEVCNILLKKEMPFLRVNDYSFFDLLEVVESDGNNQLLYKGMDLLSNIESVWYRREPEFVVSASDYATDLQKQLVKNMHYEQKVLRDFLIYKLRHVFWLSNPSNASMNKLKVLELAKEVKLNVPEWKVSFSLPEIERELNERKLITKPLFETIGVEQGADFFNTRTEVVERSDLDKMTGIKPSFFQELVEKESEIRVVFLCGKFYAMEIFSQKNDETKIDFRNYNTETPMRFSGHEIPEELKLQITELMNLLNLNFGSLDFIYTKDGKYIFLEVNPVGQFGMTSTPNNYGIEYDIAEILINKKATH